VTDADITAPGFTPDFVVTGSCWSTEFTGVAVNIAALHLGFAVNDGSATQGIPPTW